MARIEGPSPRRLIESISEKQVEAPTVDAPALPPPAPGLMGPLTPSGEPSGFADSKPKKVRMSGAFRPGPPIEPREAFAAFKLQPGVEAKGGGGTLNIKGGDAKGETKKVDDPKAALAKIVSDANLLPQAKKDAVLKQIQAGKPLTAEMAAVVGTLGHEQRAAIMTKLKPNQIEGLKALMRTGMCVDNVAIGVGVRLAADSKWGKANPQVVETMKDAYKKGELRMADDDSKIAGLGMISDSGIDLGNQLRRSPEALAATIAHESVHKHEGGGGCCSGKYDATPKGEISGNRATAALWKELNPSGKDPNLKDGPRTMLNELSGAKTDKEFQIKVVGYYTHFYQEKIKVAEKAVARGERLEQAAQKSGKTMHRDDKQQLIDDRQVLADLKAKEQQFQAEWERLEPSKKKVD